MTKRLHNAIRARELTEDLRQKGYPVARLLRETGVDPQALSEDEPFLPFDGFAALWEAAADLSDDDLLGFRWGAERRTPFGSPIGYLGKTAPNFAQFLRQISSYRRVFSDAYEFDLTRLDAEGVLAWSVNAPADASCRQAVEHGAASLMRGVRVLTGRAIRPRSVSFQHHRSQNVAEIERFFGCGVTFGDPGNTIVFRLSDLSQPLLTADEGLNGVLRRYCDDILSAKAPVETSLAQQVERYLTERIESGLPRQDTVARALGMSRRTMARRLAAEGTNYNQLVESLRKALARRYVTESDMPLTEVAFVLGYGEQSSFSTAFRRWTGHSPSQLRNAASGELLH